MGASGSLSLRGGSEAWSEWLGGTGRGFGPAADMVPARCRNISLARGIDSSHQARHRRGRRRSRSLFAPTLAPDLADPGVKLWAMNALGGFSAQLTYRGIVFSAQLSAGSFAALLPDAVIIIGAVFLAHGLTPMPGFLRSGDWSAFVAGHWCFPPAL